MTTNDKIDLYGTITTAPARYHDVMVQLGLYVITGSLLLSTRSDASNYLYSVWLVWDIIGVLIVAKSTVNIRQFDRFRTLSLETVSYFSGVFLANKSVRIVSTLSRLSIGCSLLLISDYVWLGGATIAITLIDNAQSSYFINYIKTLADVLAKELITELELTDEKKLLT